MPYARREFFEENEMVADDTDLDTLVSLNFAGAAVDIELITRDLRVPPMPPARNGVAA